jgi:hypothetical protein
MVAKSVLQDILINVQQLTAYLLTLTTAGADPNLLVLIDIVTSYQQEP